MTSQTTTEWRLAELLEATGGTFSGDQPDKMTGVSIDTRTLQQGDIYIAIKGDVHDGHIFVDKAFENGASLAIVSQDQAGGPCLKVADTLRAMEDIGIKARQRSAARRVAITGSVGKTGTKEALALALHSAGNTHASQKSYNNHWGVPLTLSRLPKEADFAVFEVGMNAPGEITPLSKMIEPDIAMITTIAPVHLAAFDNLDGIAAAKAEIFQGLKPGGTAVLNADNAYFDYLSTEASKNGAGKILSFGTSEHADVRALDINVHKQAVSVNADVCGTQLTYKIGSPAPHLVHNSLAVLGVCAALDLDLALCAMQLGSWAQGEGRGKSQTLTLPGGTAIVIDETYNANPVSMAASIKMLAQSERGPMGRHIAVLGDMLELGKTSQDWHEGLAVPLIQSDIDLVYACGPDMAHLWRILPEHVKGGYSETAQGLEEMLIYAVQPGDVIMVKGSNGIHLSTLVEALKNAYKSPA